MRYIVNLFNRLRAFPFDKDDSVQQRFKNDVTLINIDDSLIGLDASQLISLLNYFMELIKRPYCDIDDLIAAFDHFSPHHTNEIPPPIQTTPSQESSEQGTGEPADNTTKSSNHKCNAVSFFAYENLVTG